MQTQNGKHESGVITIIRQINIETRERFFFLFAVKQFQARNPSEQSMPFRLKHFKLSQLPSLFKAL